MGIAASDGEEFVYGIAELYTAAEIQIIGQVAQAASKGIEFDDFQEYQKAQIGQLQKMRAEVLKVLGKTHSAAATGMAVRIGNAYKSGGLQALKDLGKTTPGQIPPALRAATKNLVADTVGKLRSTSDAVLRSTDDIYRQIVARQVALYSAGAQTSKATTQQVISQLLGSGVTGFKDASGRNWNLTDYATMAVRTATGQAAINGHIDYARSLNVELMVIRPGPRCCDLCWPWCNVPLKMDGTGAGVVEVDSEVELETLRIQVKGSIQDARDNGWGHPNDRCNITSYIPGATDIPPHQEWDEDGYRAQQQQRGLERAIRQAKFEAAGAVTPEAAKSARAKVTARQAAMREHLDNHPYLKRQSAREGLGGAYGPLTTQKATPPDLPKGPPAPTAPKAPKPPAPATTPGTGASTAKPLVKEQFVKNSNSASRYSIDGKPVAEVYKDKKNTPDPKRPWAAHDLTDGTRTWHEDLFKAQEAATAKATGASPGPSKPATPPPAPPAPPKPSVTPPKPAAAPPKPTGYNPKGATASGQLAIHQTIAKSQGVGSVEHIRATAKWAKNPNFPKPEPQDLKVLKERMEAALKADGPDSTSFQNTYAEYIEQQWMAKAKSLDDLMFKAKQTEPLDYGGTPYEKGIIDPGEAVTHNAVSGFTAKSQALYAQNDWYWGQLSKAERDAISLGGKHPLPETAYAGKNMNAKADVAPPVPTKPSPVASAPSTTPAAAQPGWAQPSPANGTPPHPGSLKFTMPDGAEVNNLAKFNADFNAKYSAADIKKYNAFFDKAKADYLAAMQQTKAPAPNPPARTRGPVAPDPFKTYTGNIPPVPEGGPVRFSASGKNYKSYVILDKMLPSTKGRGALSTAAKGYTKHGDVESNNFLRGRAGFETPTPLAKRVIKGLDQIMDDPEFALKEDIYVSRGVHDVNTTFGGPEALRNAVGKVFKDKGYMSTSMSERPLSGFDGEVSLHIRLPKGTRAAYLDDNTHFEGEREILLDRGTSLVIQSVSYNERTGKWLVEATAVQGPREPSGL